MEEDIKYWNGYIVYPDGVVYSTKTNQFMHSQENKDGYLVINLHLPDGRRTIKVHRLVAMLYLDCPDNYEQLTVDHLDGNKHNNHYSNLEWVTRSENIKRAFKSGLNNASENAKKRWSDPEYKEMMSYKISEGKRRKNEKN